MMNNTVEIHPNAVLESLLAKGGRSQRLSNLRKMHDLCCAQHERGARDFSLPHIGRLAEAEGIMKGRALYNAQSSDYRALLGAWAAYAGPPAPKVPKAPSSHVYLMRIEDPAIRAIMQATIAERDKLKAQLNMLKSNTHLVIDRRPVAGIVTPAQKAQTAVMSNIALQLTPSEHEALKKSISADYLAERGLREGTHGEIINERGRTILDVGFARAIRKLLGD